MQVIQTWYLADENITCSILVLCNNGTKALCNVDSRVTTNAYNNKKHSHHDHDVKKEKIPSIWLQHNM